MKNPLGQQLAIRAASHRLAAHALFTANPTKAFNGALSASIWLLIGYSLELSMKAILVAGGYTESDLRRLSHKLDKILDAYQAAEGPIPELMSHVIISLTETHRDHYFRYGGADEVELPQLSVALATIEMLAFAALDRNGLNPNNAV